MLVAFFFNRPFNILSWLFLFPAFHIRVNSGCQEGDASPPLELGHPRLPEGPGDHSGFGPPPLQQLWWSCRCCCHSDSASEEQAWACSAQESGRLQLQTCLGPLGSRHKAHSLSGRWYQITDLRDWTHFAPFHLLISVHWWVTFVWSNATFSKENPLISMAFHCHYRRPPNSTGSLLPWRPKFRTKRRRSRPKFVFGTEPPILGPPNSGRDSSTLCQTILEKTKVTADIRFIHIPWFHLRYNLSLISTSKFHHLRSHRKNLEKSPI